MITNWKSRTTAGRGRKYMACLAAVFVAVTCSACSISSGPSVTLPSHPTVGQMFNACQDIASMSLGGAAAADYRTCMDTVVKLAGKA